MLLRSRPCPHYSALVYHAQLSRIVVVAVVVAIAVVVVVFVVGVVVVVVVAVVVASQHRRLFI